MERKQGFLSTPKNAVGPSFLPPARSRPTAQLQRSVSLSNLSDTLTARSGTLSPLKKEEPVDVPDEETRRKGWRQWVKGQLISRVPLVRRGNGSQLSDLKLLQLEVMGAPLALLNVHAGEPLLLHGDHVPNNETSKAEYIIRQYLAASGGQEMEWSIHNTYFDGQVRMVTAESETVTKVTKNHDITRATEYSGRFVIRQKKPDMWTMNLVGGGKEVDAGSNGEIVWRKTPSRGAYTVQGPARPLRRTLQGLNPLAIGRIFANAKFNGDTKNTNGDDCFVLKISADNPIQANSEERAEELIRHDMLGYFSQRTGLLVRIKDSRLNRTKLNATGDHAVYEEVIIDSAIEDYRPVEGIMIAHSGRSLVTLLKIGETAMDRNVTRMEETWKVDNVAFNVPGLPLNAFLPPAEIFVSETSEAGQGQVP